MYVSVLSVIHSASRVSYSYNDGDDDDDIDDVEDVFVFWYCSKLCEGVKTYCGKFHTF